MRWIRVTLFTSAMLVMGVASTAQAAVITFSGYFNDQNNTALVASDLTAALFGDDYEIANNVALYDLFVPVGGIVTFESLGWDLGVGAEPYFSLFAGSGNAATFVASNFFIDDVDFSMSATLAAGAYTVAIGVWQNLSFAENYLDPALTLSDGFIRFGGADMLGNSYYEIQVTTPATVPEPATLWLTGIGVVMVVTRRRLRATADTD